jgi:hypothetical protein
MAFMLLCPVVLLVLLAFILGLCVGKSLRCSSGQQLQTESLQEEVKIESSSECTVKEYWSLEGGTAKLHLFRDCGALKSRKDVHTLIMCDHAAAKHAHAVCDHCSRKQK